jgi:hypothetical protein
MMDGTYWTGGYDFGSAITGIDEILSQRGSFTLEDLLDHVDVISECKYLNADLVDYLSKKEVVEKLVRYVVTPNPKNSEKKDAPSQYPYIASELFACEVLDILNVFFDYPELLEYLFSFLNAPAPLEPGDCAYFCKVVVVLITKKHAQLLEFIQTHNILDKILTHIGVYSIMELLIRVGWDDGSGMSQFDDEDLDSDWLQQANLAGKLIAKLHPDFERIPEVHANAACALVDAVVKSSPMVPKTVRLVAELQTQPLLDVLFANMFASSASSLTHSLSVAIVLVQSCNDHRLQERVNAERKELGTPSIIMHVIASFPKLLKILTEPPKGEQKTQYGVLSPPCGPSRLKIIELILALVRCVAEDEDADEVTSAIATTLSDSLAFSHVLDVFAQYHWNNLLHGLVEGVVHTVLDVSEQEESTSLLQLRKHLFGSANLLLRIIELFTKNNEAVSQPKGTRLGFMGHLIRITSVIRSYPSSSLAHLGMTAENIKLWEQFLENVYKQEVSTQQIVLGGHRPGVPPASDPEENQDVDGLQIEGILESEDAFRSPYQSGEFDDDDDDDDFFNWESRDARDQIEGIDSDDSDDAILQEAPQINMDDLVVTEDANHI